jgi:hypothetical protein
MLANDAFAQPPIHLKDATPQPLAITMLISKFTRLT